MLKVITIINWLVIALLALLVAAETLSPAKGGDAAGRGMGQAIYYLAIIALLVLTGLNLLPFNWSKYTAFVLILSPFLLIKFDSALTGFKKWMARQPDGFNPDGTPWFQDQRRQALALAVWNGDTDKVKKLLQEPAPGLFDREKTGASVLEFAVSEATYTSYKPEEKVACARLLFDAGAQIPARGSQDNPIIFSPAGSGRSQLVKLLIAHGADPNARDIYYNRPVLFEAFNSYREIKETVQVLLDAGADPNAIWTDSDSTTFSALIYAAYNGRWNVCPLLIAKGADIRYQSPQGMSLKTLVDEADASFSGDGYSTRADFEQVKKAVQ